LGSASSPADETLINNSIEFYMGRGTSETQKEYLRCFRDPATVHGMCEDYRAGASIDLQHDEADLNGKIACPLLALWAANGNVGKSFDVPAVGGSAGPMSAAKPCREATLCKRAHPTRPWPNCRRSCGRRLFGVCVAAVAPPGDQWVFAQVERLIRLLVRLFASARESAV
jgi:hypothetical protein